MVYGGRDLWGIQLGEKGGKTTTFPGGVGGGGEGRCVFLKVFNKMSNIFVPFVFLTVENLRHIRK